VSSLSLFVLAVLWIVIGVPFAGFGSIVATIILCFSITILVLGIIAQYMGLIYEEVKRRPLYLVVETI
jgi:dolichol-phosphate mannosyltransferase